MALGGRKADMCRWNFSSSFSMGLSKFHESIFAYPDDIQVSGVNGNGQRRKIRKVKILESRKNLTV